MLSYYHLVCGNHALASASRKALRSLRFLEVLRGGPTISLHIEAFGDAVSFLTFLGLCTTRLTLVRTVIHQAYKYGAHK